MYLGVGNGTPWNRRVRSPGGGDNLFLASIVALDADTGEYVWHYQTAPGDTWDFTATQHIMLADLEIGGETRKVLMQAPKNGFFYVIDRTDGELLSAEPFVEVTWASRVDMRTGRPVETPNARYQEGEFASSPAAPGGITGNPWPTTPAPGWSIYRHRTCPGCTRKWKKFEFSKVTVNTGLDPIIASMPEDPQSRRKYRNCSRATCWPGTPSNNRRAGPWNSR